MMDVQEFSLFSNTNPFDNILRNYQINTAKESKNSKVSKVSKPIKSTQYEGQTPAASKQNKKKYKLGNKSGKYYVVVKKRRSNDYLRNLF